MTAEHSVILWSHEDSWARCADPHRDDDGIGQYRASAILPEVPAEGIPAGDCLTEAQACMKICSDTHVVCINKCGPRASGEQIRCMTDCAQQLRDCNDVCMKPCNPSLDGG